MPSEHVLCEKASRLYDEGQYKDAAALFTNLVLKDPLEESYWRGLAASKQMHGKFEEALHAWGLVALLANKDAWPHFHAAECLFALRDEEEGQKALDCAEERLKEGDPLRRNIQLLKERYVHTH